ncbi:hepatic and glial cell adhesion molecule-like [Phyllopteryx taeniolatus]|uniref:hepatic and glial cell adhesion molecule-like n=1 Tax=Phyllopteryx taeniolatus TaxID=161469 RepID=UPI002AD2EA63|nr:hepatic and glial cell adhesion molecule-like [Phyllopteryx taeniolatus]
MDTRLLRIAIVLLLAGTCTSQNALPPGPLSGAVSGSVTFTTTLRPTERPFSSVSWTFKGANVVTSIDEDLPGEGYGNRITLDRSTGSLELRRLTTADSGEYVVTIIPQGEGQKQLYLISFRIMKWFSLVKLLWAQKVKKKTKKTLSVSHPFNRTIFCVATVPVSRVTIQGPTTTLIEDQSSATITCEASGSVSSRVWTKDGHPLLPGPGVSFSSDNAIVSIRSVRSSDRGVYRCRVSNPISAVTMAFNLTVNCEYCRPPPRSLQNKILVHPH